MKVIKHLIETNENVYCEYPSIYKRKIDNLDKNIIYYEINKLPISSYNKNIFRLKEKITLTENTGDFLKIANVDYILEKKSDFEIIQFLNNDLGSFLDNEFPIWKRQKSVRIISNLREKGIENLSFEEKEEYNYLISLFDWLDNCRYKRDTFELNYKKNGILENIVYEQKPIKK